MGSPAVLPNQPPLQGAPTETRPTITPGDVRKIFIKRKWLLIGSLLAGAIAGLLYILLTTPQYEATARIDIDLSRSTNIGITDLIESKLSGGDQTSDRLQTEVRIMQSETVALDVIRSLDLVHKKPFSEVFKSRAYDGHLTAMQRYSLLKTFIGSLKISVLPSTELVEIRYRNPDPELATSIANAVVDAYMERDLRSRFEGTTRVSSWLSRQLDELKKQVEESQHELARFQRQNDLMGSDSEGGSLMTDSLRTVNQQLAEAEADRIVKEARYRMAETRNPELLVSVAPSTVLASLRQQQGELLVQAAQLKAKFGPDWPKVREINQQLTQVQHDIDGEINNLTQRFAEEYHAAQSTEMLMRGRLEATKQKAYRENESSAQYEILKHGAESASDLYDALQTKLKEAGITAGLNSNNIDVIDRAAVPALPVAPFKRLDLTIGLLAGLVVGVGLTLLLESLDDTVRTSDDAEAIAGLPALAVVPHFQAGKDGLADKARIERTSPDIVAYTDPQSIMAESFRSLRSSVLLSAVDRESKLVMVTSSFAAEGKSTCAANLAISFANRGGRVLLADTDLRKGTLHIKLRSSNRAGLSTLLSRESGDEAYEHPLPDIPNLTLLTRGPHAPNPGEMLGSKSMENLLARWREEYDVVILDTSPILAVSDTLNLAPFVDAVIVLVRSGVTRKKALMRTREQLARAGARLLGLIVNDVDLRLENYYTYSKGYGYGYKPYGEGYGGGGDEKN